MADKGNYDEQRLMEKQISIQIENQISKQNETDVLVERSSSF